MATYSTDDDLVAIRPNILQLGVATWDDQRLRAYTYVNRIITARWYNQAAVEMGYDPKLTTFDPTRVGDDELKDLESYKTLEFAYMLLMKDAAEADGFERNMKLFAEKFGAELELLLGTGISYDWSGDGDLEYDEVRITSPRRLIRG